MSQFCRTEMLIGEDAVKKLHTKHVAVFGLGGVGSFTVEALARVGIGSLTVVDDDVIALSNVNRQLYALHSTVGQAKVAVAQKRINDINPDCTVYALQVRFDGKSVCQFDFSSFDYVVDAIDSVTSKLLLAEICFEQNTPIISCMGTGNKLDATGFKVADIYQTTVCPLAKVMRKELKKRGIEHLKVVYSQEQPLAPVNPEQSEKRQTPASISYVPSVAGLIVAGEVIKDLIAND